MSGTGVPWSLRCVECSTTYPGLDVRYRCGCGGTLDVESDLGGLDGTRLRAAWETRRGGRAASDRSGVWRYRELVLPVDPSSAITRGEGNTGLYDSPAVAAWAGLDGILLKHEGENPTGSFKDRGMTAAVTVATRLGMRKVACASTGNTSASMASYAAIAGMRAFVFVPAGKVASGKLAQSMALGARTIEVAGDFDVAMTLVEAACAAEGAYLLNSVNPFRIEGQKTLAFELMDDLLFDPPDWVAVPGGNLGNSSAIAKGLSELLRLGLIPRMPRLAVVQAEGASPLYVAWLSGSDLVPADRPETVATAIRIGSPVSWRKSLRGVRETGGVVERVSDAEILEAKAVVDAAGIGAEPASCASVAGVRKLVAAGTIRPGDRVCCVLTGHLLKDPDTVAAYHRGAIPGIVPARANPPIPAAATLEAVISAMRRP